MTPVSQPERTQAFSSLSNVQAEVNRLTPRAAAVAKVALNGADSERNYSGCAVVHHYHQSWYWPFWCGSQQTIVIDKSQSRTKQWDDRSKRTGVMVACAVAGAAVIAFLGKDWGVGSDARFEMEEREEDMDRLRRLDSLPVRESLQRICQLEHRIFSRIKSEANFGLATKTAMLASLGISFIGAALGCRDRWEVIGAGAAGFALSGAAMLFNWGASMTEKLNARDARRILEEVNQARCMVKA